MGEIEIVSALNQLDLYPISKELTEEEIHTRWKQLIRYYHPDVNKTAIFQDGEKAKKVNSAHDFLIANLNIVNAYIRKINNIKTEEEILKEKQEQQRKAEEERKRKEAEARAYQQASSSSSNGSYTNRSSSTNSSSSSTSYNRANSSSSSTSYNRTNSSSSSTSFNRTNSYSSYNNYSSSPKPSYSYSTSKKVEYEESTLHKIIMLVELAIAVICTLLGFIMPGGSKESGGFTLSTYIIAFAIPVIILAGIPKIRKKPFVILITSFM